MVPKYRDCTTLVHHISIVVSIESLRFPHTSLRLRGNMSEIKVTISQASNRNQLAQHKSKRKLEYQFQTISLYHVTSHKLMVGKCLPIRAWIEDDGKEQDENPW